MVSNYHIITDSHFFKFKVNAFICMQGYQPDFALALSEKTSRQLDTGFLTPQLMNSGSRDFIHFVGTQFRDSRWPRLYSDGTYNSHQGLARVDIIPWAVTGGNFLCFLVFLIRKMRILTSIWDPKFLCIGWADGPNGPSVLPWLWLPYGWFYHIKSLTSISLNLIVSLPSPNFLLSFLGYFEDDTRNSLIFHLFVRHISRLRPNVTYLKP